MLEWTGERFIPGVGAEIAYEHYGRYLFASRFVATKRVLDMPCGEGFGSFLLARIARAVVGMDIDEKALEHARSRYGLAGLDFRRGDMAEPIACPDGSFEIITCFEAIEHIDYRAQQAILREFRRLLTRDGLLFISTPNKAVYTDAQDYHNPYHRHEFYFEEFRAFLSSAFPQVSFLGQTAMTGGLIASLEDRGTVNARGTAMDVVCPFDQEPVAPLQTDPEQWMYFIAVCGNAPQAAGRMFNHVVVDPKRSSIVGPPDAARLAGEAAAERDRALERLQAVVREHDERLAERDHALEDLRAAVRAHETALAQRDALLAERGHALEDLRAAVRAHETALAQRDTLLAERDHALEDLRAAVRAHETALAQRDALLAERDRALEQLQSVARGHETVLTRKDATLAERERKMEQLEGQVRELETALARATDEVTRQRGALEERERAIAAYEAERRTLGARVGRWLSPSRRGSPFPAPQDREAGLVVRGGQPPRDEGARSFTRRAIRAAARLVHTPRRFRVDWVHTSGLFDSVHYLSTHAELAARHVDPASHYLAVGWKEGADPHPLFDTSFYLERNPDVARAGMNPLWHYIHFGWREGRDPHPLFDTSFYLDRNLDVAQAGVNPLWHYIHFGWKEGRDPHPEFDTSAYLDDNPSLPSVGVNPLTHYVEFAQGTADRPAAKTRPAVLAAASRLLESLDPSGPPSPEEMARRYLEPLAALWTANLARRTSASVEERAFGAPPRDPRCSVIVPLYGRYDFLLHHLHHFSRDRDFELTDLVYVVDDPAIIDGVIHLAAAVAAQYAIGFRVLYQGDNYGYAAANNLGAAHARAPLLLLLNSDVMPARPGWLSRLETVHASLADVGALGVRLLFEDRSIQHTGMAFRHDPRFPGVWLNDHPGKGLPETLVPSRGVVPVPAVTGACLMIAADRYREAGGLDEGYVIGDFEDSDLCLALARRGYVNYLADDIVLYHLERQSHAAGADATLRFKLTLCNAFRHTARWDSAIRAIGGSA